MSEVRPLKGIDDQCGAARCGSYSVCVEERRKLLSKIDRLRRQVRSWREGYTNEAHNAATSANQVIAAEAKVEALEKELKIAQRVAEDRRQAIMDLRDRG
jgi:hypothetical protein